MISWWNADERASTGEWFLARKDAETQRFEGWGVATNGEWILTTGDPRFQKMMGKRRQRVREMFWTPWSALLGCRQTPEN